MQSSNRPRAKRQPAIRIFSQEFSESTLTDKGPDEFDPAFVITKLGCMVNRALVAGLLESLNLRETSGGNTMWQGTLRDPSGLHYFSVGDFQGEALLAHAAQLSSDLENGDPIQLMMVAKTRLFQSDDGSIYTSLKPEEMCVINPNTYANWLVETSEATMQRIKDSEMIRGLEADDDTYVSAGITRSKTKGMVLAKNHYGEVDSEVYKLTVMRSLDIAEGKNLITPNPISQPSVLDNENNDSGANEQTQTSSEMGDDGDSDAKGDVATDRDVLRATIQTIIRTGDSERGIDLATIIANCEARGFSQNDTDICIDELVDGQIIEEGQFGWFKISQG
ncbi:MAG: hypothetical protein HOC79_01435 [Euryarchaeota archaeon]|nr:hypothetical protein [Euryarchaeota archaeon]